jgi:hypothetical protein
MKTLLSVLMVVIITTICYGQSQFVSMEEILKRNIEDSTKIIQKQFKLDGPIYSDFTDGRNLSLITADNRNPKSTYWLDSNAKFTQITKRTRYECAIAFLIEPNRISTQTGTESTSFISYYNSDGKLLKTLDGFIQVTPSPSGKYIINATNSESGYPLNVFDYNGNELFHLSTTIELVYQAAWYSDSLLIVGSGGTLTLWDVSVSAKMWEIEMPSGSRGINEEFEIIASRRAGIIIVYDTYQSCYCFNPNGDLLWQKSRVGDLTKIDGVGICDTDGRITLAANYNSGTNLDVLAKDGSIIAQADRFCPPESRYHGHWQNRIDMSGDYCVFRYASYKIMPGEKPISPVFITVIASYQNNKLNLDYVDGLWFLLHGDNDSQAMIGVDNDMPDVAKAYLIK